MMIRVGVCVAAGRTEDDVLCLWGGTDVRVLVREAETAVYLILDQGRRPSVELFEVFEVDRARLADYFASLIADEVACRSANG